MNFYPFSIIFPNITEFFVCPYGTVMDANLYTILWVNYLRSYQKCIFIVSYTHSLSKKLKITQFEKGAFCKIE